VRQDEPHHLLLFDLLLETVPIAFLDADRGNAEGDEPGLPIPDSYRVKRIAGFVDEAERMAMTPVRHGTPCPMSRFREVTVPDAEHRGRTRSVVPITVLSHVV
jgi:hypothetical protein